MIVYKDDLSFIPFTTLVSHSQVQGTCTILFIVIPAAIKAIALGAAGGNSFCLL